MKVVVDTNILFSFFWEDSFTKRLLSSSPFELISPEYALSELHENKDEIMKKTKITVMEFESYINELKLKVKFIPLKDYEIFKKEALQISPDKKDSDFLALTLENSCYLWSNDSLLKKQNKVKVLTTEEIIYLL